MTPHAEPVHGGRVMVASLAVGVAGLLLWVFGAASDPAQAYFSWLAAFAWGLSTVLGALILVMIGHLTAAHWLVLLRRLAESIAAVLPLFALLWLPLFFGVGYLYPWTHPSTYDPELRQTLVHQAPYLNLSFWIIRAALYFVLWAGTAELLRRASLRQDAGDPHGLTTRQRRLSAGMIFPLALAFTFATFDWLMVLTPGWVSSAFGVYVFGGGMLGALALLALLVLAATRTGRIDADSATANVHALGKLMLTFVIFWAYIAYAQGFLIWIADLPEEVQYYLPRSHGGWGWIGIALMVGHFAIPFLLLLPWGWKRHAGFVAAVGGWLLVMHYLDLYWMVLPALHPEGVHAHWLDAAALLAVGGLATAFGVWRLRGHGVVPVGDPCLPQSLRYTSR